MARGAVAAWQDAGIFASFASGDDGSLAAPAAFPESFAVGALNGQSGQVAEASGKVTEYPIPEDGIPEAYPSFLSSASGKLWFSMDSFGAFLGSVTTTGVFTEFTLQGFPNQGGKDTSGLAVGRDGNIWYTIGDTDQVVELVVPH